jgi:predicted permease
VKALRRLWSRLRGAGASEAELSEELAAHVAMLEEENLRRGLAPAEARRRALVRFGGLAATKDAWRDQRGLPWLETLAQDVRYALRGMRRNPGFTAVAVGCLALGIGANTAIFSVMNAVALRNLPLKEPARLRIVAYSAPGGRVRLPISTWGFNRVSLPWAVYQAMASQARSISGIAAFVPLGFGDDNLTLTLHGQASAAAGELVSGNYFQVLGVRPRLGRALVPSDGAAGAPVAAVVSERYWRRALGASAAALGSEVRMNGEPATIVGVAPGGFLGLNPAQPTDVWLVLRPGSPLQPWGRPRAAKPVFTDRSLWWCSMVVRLAPGVSEARACAELGSLYRNTVAETLATPAERERIPAFALDPAGRGLDNLRPRLERPLRILLSAAALVLLIACLNVATLLVARGRARQAEIRVRLALGASRWRLVRQLLTESVMLASAGAAAGFALAWWGSRALLRLLPVDNGGAWELLDVRPDGTVLLASLAAALLTGLVFGLVPALRTTASALPGLARGAGAMLPGRLMVCAQVAVSAVLLVGAGLFVRTLANLRGSELGFRTRGVLVFRLDPERQGYAPERSLALYRQSLERLGALAGVHSAALSDLALLGGWNNMSDCYTDAGRQPVGGDGRTARWNGVSPGFLATMGIGLKLGRDLEWRDLDGGRRVAVVNEAFARHFFPGENPLGRRFSSGGRGWDPEHSWEIVGVSAYAKYSQVWDRPPAAAYLLYAAQPPRFAGGAKFFEIRTQGDPRSLLPAVRRVFGELAPGVPLLRISTQEEVVEQALSSERMFAGLSSLFGLLALLLVAIGVYGTLAYMVVRRTGEIGIRMALGAGRGRVVWMVLRNALALAAAGLAAGVPAALALARYLESQLYEVKPQDTFNAVAAALLLLAVTAAAALLPAARAARIAPATALRSD